MADQIRDQALSELGLVVLRFSNKQILTETDVVVEQIYSVVKLRLKSPFVKGGLYANLMQVLDSWHSLLFKGGLGRIK